MTTKGTVAVLATLGLVALSAAGGENGKSKKGPLAALPSKAGPHLAKVEALGDGKWLNLGKPKPDPKWGPAWGRGYTPKMAYAADIEGAFLNGQGVHGFVKKKFNRVMDDTWFYDVNAHAWVCCYPGTHLPTVEKDWKVNADGFLVNAEGESPPMTGVVHGYNSVSYSPKHRKFITWHGVGYTRKPIAAMWTKRFPDKSKLKHYHNRQHPYFYDVATGRWTRHKTTGRGPGSFRIYGANCEWLPTKGVFALYIWKGPVWLYRLEEKKWDSVNPAGPAPAGGYEGVSCYDSKRHRIYLLGNKRKKITAYDVEANKWLAAEDDFCPVTASGRSWHTTATIVNYDAASDVVVAFHRGKTAKGAYVFDCEKLKWLNREPLPDSRKKGGHGFYSPKQNAHYFFNAGDSRTTPGDIWVWRYKRAKK
jgi:hypothetical protein